MKRLLFIMLVFAASFTAATANVENEQPGGVNISLSCSYVRWKPLGTQGGRTPMMMPEISITESSVEVGDRLIGYTMTILFDGEIVCEQIVTSTHVSLPFSLSGDYEIQFTNDTYCFYGFFSI